MTRPSKASRAEATQELFSPGRSAATPLADHRPSASAARALAGAVHAGPRMTAQRLAIESWAEAARDPGPSALGDIALQLSAAGRPKLASGAPPRPWVTQLAQHPPDSKGTIAKAMRAIPGDGYREEITGDALQADILRLARLAGTERNGWRICSFDCDRDGALTLKSLRHGSNGEIARFAEIADRNAAEAMRGTQITVPRADLPPLEEGEYYHADLLGLAAVSTEGEGLGRVIAIDNYGAGDVIEIERPDGKRFMIPMNPDAVPEWNAERLIVDAAFTD